MDRFVGFALIAVSAAGFGTLAISGRYAYQDGLDALTILFFRFSLSAVVLVPVLVSRCGSLPRGWVLLRLMGMGAFGYVGQAFCYLTALNYASAGLVALLLYLYPAFVTILSVIVLREHLTGFKAMALCLALIGTALTVGPGGGRWLGIILGISAAVIYSVYIIIGTGVVKEVSAVESSAVIFASAGAMSGLLMLVKGPHMPSSVAGWWAIVSIVLLATVLPVVTFLAGLKRTGPTNAAMLSTLEPVVTVVLAALLLDETLKPLTMAGGALILLAVLLLAQDEFRRGRP
jgi:drug/metabolite transporter (DMT)-like permease